MAYTHIQCIGYKVPTGVKLLDGDDSGEWTIPSGVVDDKGTYEVKIITIGDSNAYTLTGDKKDKDDKYYVNNLENDLDAKNRVIRFLNVLVTAVNCDKIDRAAATLKVFMAPEFYFRPEESHTLEDLDEDLDEDSDEDSGKEKKKKYYAYSYETYQAIKAVLRQTIEKSLKLKHWLIIPGTIMWKLDVEKDTKQKKRIINKNTYFNSCVYIHNSEGKQTSHVQEKAAGSAEDGIPALDRLATHRKKGELAAHYTRPAKIAKHLFEIDGLRVGLEICLEHRMFEDELGLINRALTDKVKDKTRTVLKLVSTIDKLSKYSNIQVLNAANDLCSLIEKSASAGDEQEDRKKATEAFNDYANKQAKVLRLDTSDTTVNDTIVQFFEQKITYDTDEVLLASLENSINIIKITPHQDSHIYSRWVECSLLNRIPLLKTLQEFSEPLNPLYETIVALLFILGINDAIKSLSEICAAFKGNSKVFLSTINDLSTQARHVALATKALMEVGDFVEITDQDKMNIESFLSATNENTSITTVVEIMPRLQDMMEVYEVVYKVDCNIENHTTHTRTFRNQIWRTLLPTIIAFAPFYQLFRVERSEFRLHLQLLTAGGMPIQELVIKSNLMDKGLFFKNDAADGAPYVECLKYVDNQKALDKVTYNEIIIDNTNKFLYLYPKSQENKDADFEAYLPFDKQAIIIYNAQQI